MRRCFILPLIIVVGLIAFGMLPCFAQLMNSSWPEFRHDGLHSGRSSLAGPSAPALAWSHQIGAGVSSPALGSNALYVLAGGNLIAMSLSGEQLWSYPCGSGMRSSPAIDSSGVIYVASDAWLYAINSDGSLKFRKTLPGTSDCSPAIGTDGTVYIGCSQSKFQAYTSTGLLKFTYTTGGAVSSSAAIGSDGTIYFGCNDGCLYALKSDGTLKWKFSTNPSGAIQASPAIGSDGTVYFGNMSGYFFAVSSTGTQKWRYGSGVTNSSPAIASDGTIYFGSQDNSLYALNKVGTLRWKYTVRGSINSSPAIDSSGNVYFGSDDGSIYAVNSSGAKLWEYAAGSAVGSSPAIGDSSLYALTYAGALIRLSADTTPPSTPVVTDDGAYSTSPSTLHVSWLSSDSESGISRYEYAIGISPGTQDLLPFTDAGTATEISRTGLNLVNGATYYISVRATNGAGILGDIGVSDGIMVDYTPPATPIVTDDGKYTSSSDTMHASWFSSDSETGVLRYEYAIGTSPGIQDLLPFTDAGTATEITRTGLVFIDGATYYISVRAINSAGLVSEIGSANGIMVDYTPPATPVVIDDGKYTSSQDTLHFVFGSGDTESGIAYYEYSIGTQPGHADTLDWQNIGLISVRDIIMDSLTLMQATTYYINVRAYNHAGLMSEGYSNGILVDLTPPPVPVIELLSSSLNEIKLRITASDAESGVVYTQYAILDSLDTSNAQWIDCEAGTEIVVSGTFNSSHVYVAAQAKNGAELWSSPAIKQVISDATPPTTPIVNDDGDYSTNKTTLHAAWSSSDPETGIAYYLYCLGTAAGLSDIIQWTKTTDTSVTLSGLNLTNSAKYYFSVKAANNTGMESAVGSSNGITVDTTPPTIPTVTDDGDYTSVADTLHAVFSASDAQSGIAEYSFCIGTASGASDVVAWTSTGSVPSATAYNLSLIAGKRYYFSVKARNNAGLWGEIGTSDGIEYKQQGSVWPKFHYDSANAGRSAISACLSGRVNFRVQTDGYVESSAAFAGDGTAYVGSSDGNLYAISANGSVRWSYPTGGAVDSSPAIGSQGEIYFGSCDNYLYCVQPNGSFKWKFLAGDMIWSSPNIGSDGTIYFGCQDGFVYAVKPDGNLKWKYNAGSEVWSSPALASDGSIYFACGNGKLYALTSAGVFKWAYQTGTAADSSPSIDVNGVIYFGSGDGYFYAINPNGTLKWRVYTGALVDSSAAIASDGTVYVGTGGAGYSGSMRAYSTEGVELWKINLTGGVRSSPAIDASGNIYFGTADGHIYALHSNGTTIWIYTGGESVLSSPAIGPDGQVIVGCDDGGIYCFKDYAQDNTAPIRPVVTPAQSFVPYGAPIICSWSSSDFESGIASYSYAVGTQPGLSDLANWTNAALAISFTRSDFTLSVGQSCYVSVKAINHAGLESEVGMSGAITIIANNLINLIGDAKKRINGTQVYLAGKVVTAVFSDSVFIEEPNRSSGIRCSIASSDISVGAVVDALGKITLVNGETILSNVTLSKLNAAAGSINPVAVNMRTLAGSGLDITGLLVRVAGKVTKSGAYYFIISDGSKVTSPRGVKGIEVRANAGDIPLLGTCAAITGVVSKDVINGVPSIIIRAGTNPSLMVIP